MFATGLDRCGGGPAANAAITVCRLGLSAAFAGYLGYDSFGEENLRELHRDGVNTSLVVRGDEPTSLSCIIVPPDGSRTIVNYRGGASKIPDGSIDFTKIESKVILVDSHEPFVSPALARTARQSGIPLVLDAGNVRPASIELLDLVDYAVCAETFARDYTGLADPMAAAGQLLAHAPHVVVTLGDRGLVWQSRVHGSGSLAAFTVEAVDTTGAGDTFHGAFAAGLAAGLDWLPLLRYASATAAICCTHIGGRPGIPTGLEVQQFLLDNPG
jgi:sulfofructose kinase